MGINAGEKVQMFRAFSGLVVVLHGVEAPSVHPSTLLMRFSG